MDSDHAGEKDVPEFKDFPSVENGSRARIKKHQRRMEPIHRPPQRVRFSTCRSVDCCCHISPDRRNQEESMSNTAGQEERKRAAETSSREGGSSADLISPVTVHRLAVKKIEPASDGIVPSCVSNKDRPPVVGQQVRHGQARIDETLRLPEVRNLCTGMQKKEDEEHPVAEGKLSSPSVPHACGRKGKVVKKTTPEEKADTTSRHDDATTTTTTTTCGVCDDSDNHNNKMGDSVPDSRLHRSLSVDAPSVCVQTLIGMPGRLSHLRHADR